jgi:hypothetical protein
VITGCTKSANLGESRLKVERPDPSLGLYDDLSWSSVEVNYSLPPNIEDPIDLSNLNPGLEPLIWLQMAGTSCLEGSEFAMVGGLRYRPFRAKTILKWWRTGAIKNPITNLGIPLSNIIYLSKEIRSNSQISLFPITLDNFIRSRKPDEVRIIIGEWIDRSTSNGGLRSITCGSEETCIMRAPNGMELTSSISKTPPFNKTFVESTEPRSFFFNPPFNFLEAANACAQSTYGGYPAGTWRLPTSDEWSDFVKMKIFAVNRNDWIPLNSSYNFWTSSEIVSWNNRDAWMIMKGRSVHNVEKSSRVGNAFCVKSAVWPGY